jgi:glycerol-3-phosphate dehydrogenase
MDNPDTKPIIAPSQGVHLVLERSFLAGDAAIMVPRTSDGRVLFAIPWHEHTLLGTTDTPIKQISLEPVAMEEEVQFILDTASEYLARRPTRADVLTVFAGIRPLAKASDVASTAALSREHTIEISKSGLLSIAGGKWTTYRKMAEDCVDHAAILAKLDERPCVTNTLHIHGFQPNAKQLGHLSYYGSDAGGIRDMIAKEPLLGQQLHPALPIQEAEVVWASRHEVARTVDDVLSRRTRALFLNAKAAIAMAPTVAKLMAGELGRDEQWETEQVSEFSKMAQGYMVPRH